MAKYKSKGATLHAEDVNPPTELVGQLGDFTVDLGARGALVDVSTHDTSATMDKLDPGLKEPITITGELIYDPADTKHEELRAAHAAGTLLYFKVTLPDAGAATLIFQGRIGSLGIGLPVQGKMAAPITIEGVGAYTFAA